MAMHLLNKREELIHAHVQLSQEPYGLHTSVQQKGWSAAFPVQGENTPDQLPTTKPRTESPSVLLG